MTDGELRLMRVLWDRGQATVGAVVEAVETRA
jgi:predicted transcriptional regulator